MSTHPNVILMAVLTPQGLARQTMKAILHVDYSHDAAPQVTISGEDYDALVMESDYDESLQISAKEGDLVFYDLVTYGFGEVVTWASLEAPKTALGGVGERDECSARLRLPHRRDRELLVT